MIEIEVKKDIFEEIRYMNDDSFNRYLRNRLKLLLMEIEKSNEKKLVEKINETKKRIDEMLKEISYLSQFSRKAEEDKKNMEEWVEKLDEENQKFLEALKNDRNNN